MYIFSNDFMQNKIAIVIPQEHFDEFLESCIELNIPDADDDYTRSWACDRYSENVGVFAEIAYGDYLCLWRDTPNGRDDCESERDEIRFFSWDEAIKLEHIRPISHIPQDDILKLL